MKVMNPRTISNDVSKEFYGFYPYKERDNLIQWIRDCFLMYNDNTKAIINVADNKNSIITTTLCVQALGKNNVIGVLMPENDFQNVQKLQKFIHSLDIKSYEINAGQAAKAIIDPLKYHHHIPLSHKAKNDVLERTKSSILQSIAVSLNGKVVGSLNLSDRIIGNYTPGGEDNCDLIPIADYTITELQLIGKTLSLSNDIIYNNFSTDTNIIMKSREVLDFSYDDLDKYIRSAMNSNDIIIQKIEDLANKSIANEAFAKYSLSSLPICVENFVKYRIDTI